MHTYTRKHLVDALIDKFQMDSSLAKNVVEETLVQIAAQLVAGRRIEFRGFGVFEPRTMNARVGRNPRKLENGDYIIPARKTVRFRPGRDFLRELAETGAPVQPSNHPALPCAPPSPS